MDKAGRLLGQLVAFAEECAETLIRTETETALAWATRAAGAAAIWTSRREAEVRLFARHLPTLDPRTEAPPADLLPARGRRATPYLYAPQEVAGLMQAAGHLRGSHGQAIYRTSIGLLAATGMRITSLSMAEVGERLPLQDDRVRWYGECVAVVVADTLLAARAAARLVVVEYDLDADAPPLAVTLDEAGERLKPVKRAGIAPGKVARGDAEAAHSRAEIQVDAEYRNAPYHHNTIEPSAVIARWDEDGGVTIHAAVQWHHVDTLAIGQAFGLGYADGLLGFARRKLLGHAFAGKVRLVNHLAGGVERIIAASARGERIPQL